MYSHTVIFKLNGNDDERRRLATEFASAIIALRDKIDVIVDVVAGVNINPGEQADVMLAVKVEQFEHIAAYSNHPDHLAAAALLKGHVDCRLCVDTEITD